MRFDTNIHLRTARYREIHASSRVFLPCMFLWNRECRPLCYYFCYSISCDTTGKDTFCRGKTHSQSACYYCMQVCYTCQYIVYAVNKLTTVGSTTFYKTRESFVGALRRCAKNALRRRRQQQNTSNRQRQVQQQPAKPTN